MEKKRSLHAVNAHFGPDVNAASCRLSGFEQSARSQLIRSNLSKSVSTKMVAYSIEFSLFSRSELR